MSTQAGWRWCRNCQVLFFSGHARQGICQGMIPHDGSASGKYVMEFGDAGIHDELQGGWRWCHQCEGMHFAGLPHTVFGGGNRRMCFGSLFDGGPDLGRHDPSQSATYVMETRPLPEIGPAGPGAQAGWRFCMKCFGLYFSANADQGKCPSGGAHDISRSRAYVLRFEGAPARDPVRDKMLEKYNRIGGHLSPLGLPVDSQMPVIDTGQGFRMNFRGGHIEVPAGGGAPVAVKRLRAEVWWMGIECQVRQEGTDEVYGGIGVMVPGSGLSSTEKFSDDSNGSFGMGPDGMRIINTARLLYNGPPVDIVLSVSLIEHDSGDTSDVKAKIAGAVAKAAQALAGTVGIPAEATSATDGWVNDLSAGLVNAVGNLFGIDDDPYPPQQLRLRWPEIQGQQFVRKTARRDDDPRTIEHTHSVTVSGVDDGGDRGQYALYFDVRVMEEQEVLAG